MEKVKIFEIDRSLSLAGKKSRIHNLGISFNVNARELDSRVR